MRYKKQFDGDWIQPIKRGYKLRCCDCGLVHKVNFRIVKGKIQLQPFRDERATAASRRGFKGIKFHHGKIKTHNPIGLGGEEKK